MTHAPRPEAGGALSYLFKFSRTVDRRSYLSVGVGLALVKYALDVGVVWAGTRSFWTPLSYFTPSASLNMDTLGAMGATSDLQVTLLSAMAIYALPFLWIGLSMSVRRAADAGLSPWLGVLFLIPGVNWLLMAGLSIAPTRAPWRDEGEAPEGVASVRAAAIAVLAGVAQTLAATAASIYAFGEYGSVLFFATPCSVGLIAGFLMNMRAKVGIRATLGAASAAVSLAGLSLLLFAIEGVICIAMALPLALTASAIGAVAGRAIAVQVNKRRIDGQGPRGLLGAIVVACVMPLMAGAESLGPKRHELYEVTTAVTIDAPPEAVWDAVIDFKELAPPPAWVERMGIAYPIRARLEGRGVGAVRHCEFSTGAFVEPITVWEPGRRLAFDVRSQPAPMREWSPYRAVHPPHLDGYWRSKRGEFRFAALAGGRTKLEGTTWYELEMTPSLYWRAIAGSIIHGIHARVLAGVRADAERRS